MESIKVIDKVIKEKIEENPSVGEYYYYAALDCFLDNEYAQFLTRKKDGENLLKISKEDLFSEVIKNMVKIKIVRERYKFNEARNMPDSFANAKFIYDKELFLYNELTNNDLSEYFESLNHDQEKRHAYVRSFISRRYFDKRYKPELLDNIAIYKEEDFNLLDAIDKTIKKKKTYK